MDRDDVILFKNQFDWTLRLSGASTSDPEREGKIITNKMAEVPGPSHELVPENILVAEDSSDNCEPEKKKLKLDVGRNEREFNLEERLNGILCCTVCLDLPTGAVYQVRTCIF